MDVETGERVWHFQAVHHGLWDYDFPTHSNLVDVVVDGRPIKALVQVSKQAFVYAFDRVTGEPVWPIEERPVPQETNMPDEVPSPTQPFPTKPEPFDYQGVTVDDLVDFTPELREMAMEVVANFQIGPLFTPPGRPIEGGTQGTLMRPPDGGAAGWAGAAVDPETGILYVPSRNIAVAIPLYTPDPALGATMRYTHGAPEERRLEQIQQGQSYQAQMPQGLPLLKPPYSRITAIDMNTGEHVWMVPPAPPAPEPAAARRRHHRRPGPHQNAPHQLCANRRTERWTRAGRVGQADRRDPGGRRPPRRNRWHADDLHAGWPAVYRRVDWRRSADRGVRAARASGAKLGRNCRLDRLTGTGGGGTVKLTSSGPDDGIVTDSDRVGVSGFGRPHRKRLKR